MNSTTLPNQNLTAEMSALPFPRKPDHKEDDMARQPQLKEVPLEAVSSGNGNLERWKFAFQIISVVLVIIIALTGFGYWVYNTGVERGIEKERMRMIEQRQIEDATKKEREERIRVDRLEDKANELDEVKKQQEQNQKKGK